MSIFLLSSIVTPCFYLSSIHLLLAKPLIALDLVIDCTFSN